MVDDAGRIVLHGRGASPGIAIGHIRFADDFVRVDRITIEDVQKELERVRIACDETVRQLQNRSETLRGKLGDDAAYLFEIHAMMIEDEDFQSSLTAKIADEHVCAEYAVQETGDEFASIFSSMDDEYMSGRANDVLDVSRQIIRNLGFGTKDGSETDTPRILAADDFSPSQTARFERSQVPAFVTRDGSMTSHTAIFARTVGIPAIVGLGPALRMEFDGKLVIVDGTSGQLLIDPEESVVATYRREMEQMEHEQKVLEGFRGKPTKTSTGHTIRLFANIGSVEDARYAVDNDAEGIGLLRSEFLFLKYCGSAPDEETQFNAYRKVIRFMEGKPIIIRTIDIGADKQVPYLGLEEEQNPALGLRGIRLALKRPAVFETQLRAIYRAASIGDVSIMIPMVNSLDDVIAAKEIARQVRENLASEHVRFSDNVPFGIMIETPAAALISDELARHVDFFSIGTNDLTQYTLAVDRQNNMLEEFCDTHHEAILRLIRMTVENAHRAGIWAGICGELGADESLIDFFIDIGIDELSVAPSNILRLRSRIATGSKS